MYQFLVSLLGTVSTKGALERGLGTGREKGGSREPLSPVSRRGFSQSGPVLLWGQHSWLPPGGREHVFSAPANLSLRAESFGRVRFWGPYYVDDGAITLNCSRTGFWCSLRKGGRPANTARSLQAVYLGAWFILSQWEGTRVHLCPPIPCSPRAALSIGNVSYQTFRLLPAPCSPANWVVLMSTVVP